MRPAPDRNIPLLVAALVVGMASHVAALPLWINVWCLGLWMWVLILHRKSWPVPPRWLQFILSGIAFAAIIVTARGRFDSDSGIGLLCLMASLKPFEIKGHRDRMITLFLAYFMVIASLFFSTSLEMTAYLFVSVIVITGLLIRVNHPGVALSSGIRLSTTIVLQALPLALILFALFPRIQGSLWGIQIQKKGLTGLSDTMYPGSMTELVKNNEVAFRVSFEDGAPPPQTMYWRAMVYQAYDGRKWLQRSKSLRRSSLPDQGDVTRYELILEPHNQNWLFTLDYPASFVKGYTLMDDYTLRSREKIATKIRYDASSFLRDHTGPEDTVDWLSRALPTSVNPRARDLAASLHTGHVSTQGFVDSVLAYFNTNPYYYSLSASPYVSDYIDDFLFRSRKGYCEHYASAFVFMMRSEGVPARVVGGYYGGEVNPYADYVIVRQAFAHAWAEVWMEGQGWVRVDPTTAIPQDRVEVEPLGTARGGADNTLAAQKGNGFFSLWAGKAVLAWDAVSYIWYARILGYSSEDQKSFLQRFGLSVSSVGGWLKVFAIGAILVSLLVGAYYFRQSAKDRKKKDPVQAMYQLFLKKLARVGIEHAHHEGPRYFAEKAVAQRNDLVKDILGISRIYIMIRYGGHDKDRELIKAFSHQVRHFRPERVRENQR